MSAVITDRDLYYLRSIHRQLRQLMERADELSLGTMVLADNADWLDCFIELQERGAAPPNHVEFVNG